MALDVILEGLKKKPKVEAAALLLKALLSSAPNPRVKEAKKLCSAVIEENYDEFLRLGLDNIFKEDPEPQITAFKAALASLFDKSYKECPVGALDAIEELYERYLGDPVLTTNSKKPNNLFRVSVPFLNPEVSDLPIIKE